MKLHGEFAARPTERYARGSFAAGTLEVTVGIYYDLVGKRRAPGGDVTELATRCRALAEDALRTFGGNHALTAEYLAERIADEYPDRPFFVETDEVGTGVQVYQPYGMPLNPTNVEQSK